MKRKKVQNEVDNRGLALFAFVITIFIVGFLAGSMVSFQLYSNDLLIVVNDIHKTIKNLVVYKSYSLLFKSFFTHFVYIFAIWFLALSVFGIILVIFILFFIGFMYGFVLSSFSYQLGLRGLWVGLVYTFPQNIIILPLVIFVCTKSIRTALQLFGSIYTGTNRKEFKAILNSYYNILFFSIGALVIYALMMSIFGNAIVEYLKSYIYRW